jgi:hypothetical protein
MKIAIIIILSLTNIQLKAQVNNDSVYLFFDAYSDTIAKRLDGEIELSLKNESHYPIIIPSSAGKQPLGATAKIYDLEIYYEIIRCNRGADDTIFKNKPIIGIDINYINPVRFAVLEPSETKKIRCHLDYGYFRKIGIYKIRFGFKASRLNKFYKDVYSDWITVYVKNPDFMNVE